MIEVNFTGLVIATLPERSGVSQRGAWRCASYLVEYVDLQGYPTKVCLEVWGDDRINQMGLKVGNSYKLTCFVESKEFNGKWFTSVRGLKAERVILEEQPTQEQPKPKTQQSVPTPPERQEVHNEMASQALNQIKEEKAQEKEESDRLFPDDLPF